jgi:hypothetical protein
MSKGLFGTHDWSRSRERGSTTKWGSQATLGAPDAHGFLPPTWERATMECTGAWPPRKTLAGEFIVVNKKLVKMLEERDSGHGDQASHCHQRGSIRAVVISQSLFGAIWGLKQKALPSTLVTEAVLSVPEHERLHGRAPRGKVKAMLTWAWNAGLRLVAIYYLRSLDRQSTTVYDRGEGYRAAGRSYPEEPVAEGGPLSTFLALRGLYSGRHFWRCNAPCISILALYGLSVYFVEP